MIIEVPQHRHHGLMKKEWTSKEVYLIILMKNDDAGSDVINVIFKDISEMTVKVVSVCINFL